MDKKLIFRQQFTDGSVSQLEHKLISYGLFVTETIMKQREECKSHRNDNDWRCMDCNYTETCQTTRRGELSLEEGLYL